MNRNRLWLRNLVLLNSLIAATVVTAQEKSADRPAHLVAMLSLIVNESVLHELGIESDSPQLSTIRKLNTRQLSDARVVELRKELRKPNSVDRAKVVAAMSKLQRQYDAELEKLLTAKQFTRLKQIHLQKLGICAFHDVEIVYELEISDEQKEQLVAMESEVLSESLEKARQSMNPTSDRPDSVANSQNYQQRGRVLGISTELVAKAEQILTQKQRERFAELKGNPFDLELLRTQSTGRLRQAPDRQ